MASRFSFRQHILLLLFLDIFILMFVGVSSSSSFLIDFINIDADTGLQLSATSGIFFVILTLFIGISAIGVTTGSNFAGVSGIISAVFGVATKTIATGATGGVIAAVITDYIMVYNFMIDGNSFGMLNIVAMLIFFPLIVDALFASIDWARGVSS
jgi:hypothetical protein